MDKRHRTRQLIPFLVLLIAFFASFSLKANEPEILSPDEAFKVSAKKLNDNEALLHFDIAKGYLLYEEHLQILNMAGKAIPNNKINLPKPIVKQDEILGTYKVYSGQMDVTVPLSKKGNDPSMSGFQVKYQGCGEEGFCYPPQTKEITITKTGQVIIKSLASDDDSPPLSSNTEHSEPQITHESATDTSLSHSPTKTTSLQENNNSLTESQLTNESTSGSSLHNASLTGSSLDNDSMAGSALHSNPVSDHASLSESDQIASLFYAKSFPITLLVFLGLGIMLACTPCVLPMIPILANIIVGQGAPLSKKRSTYLASLYVLSVAVCYSVAGVLAGLLGSHFQNTLQQPIFLIILSLLLLLFALSQFNLIHVQLPSIFGSALQKLEQKQKQGSAIGAVVMGAISALMVSPCVTPALVGALTYIGQTGSALLGGAALFALALGMGLPLLVVACIGGHLLPKAGPWMKHIKHITGILLLVVAGSIFMRAIPSSELHASTMSNTPFMTVHDVNELSQALAKAKALKTPVILDVYADWCITCKQMDKEVFENQDVLKRLKEVRLLRLDLTKQTKGHDELQEKLGIIGPPMVLFFDLDGNEIKSYRIAGKSETHHFMDHLSNFLKKTKKDTP